MMSFRRAALLASMLVLCHVDAAEPAATLRVQKAVDAATGDRRQTYPYLLSLPEGYNEDDERWPLLLFLHGAGHRGDDLAKLVTLGPPKLIEEGPGLSEAEKSAARVLRTRFIVVSPQCPSNRRWQNEPLLALLDRLLAGLKVDASRVYVTGASMGGSGTWALATRYPERFAAIAPICGGGDIRDVIRAPRKTLAELRRLRVWAFHCDEDPTVPLRASQEMINAFTSIGANAQLTVYESERHDAWTRAYSTLALYDWLLRFSLPAPKSGP